MTKLEEVMSEEWKAGEARPSWEEAYGPVVSLISDDMRIVGNGPENAGRHRRVRRVRARISRARLRMGPHRRGSEGDGMILDDSPTPAPGRPWSPWRDGILHALLVGAVTAIGTELGKWGVERLRRHVERSKSGDAEGSNP